MGYRFDEAAWLERQRLVREEFDRIAIIEMDSDPISEGLCYFWGDVNVLIKIGYSRNVNQRIRALNSSSGPYCFSLLAMARGGRDREMHYHHRFQAHRWSGEFFNPHPDIVAEIDKLVAATPLPRWAERRLRPHLYPSVQDPINGNS